MSDKLISLAEYAALHRVTPDTIRQGVLSGRFPQAAKIGRNWVIPADAPFLGGRRKKQPKPPKE